MSAVSLTFSLLFATAVYRFTDARGVEHFVDQLDEVPSGIHPQQVNLDEIPLNHEAARDLANAAKSGAEKVAQERADAAKRGEAPPPPEAQTALIWAIGLTVAYLGLWILGLLLRKHAPELAAAFGVMRLVAGGLAMISWGVTIYEYRESRRWLVQNVPALRALDQTVKTKQAADQRQKDLEKQTDQLLKSN